MKAQCRLTSFSSAEVMISKSLGTRSNIRSLTHPPTRYTSKPTGEKEEKDKDFRNQQASRLQQKIEETFMESLHSQQDIRNDYISRQKSIR